MGGNNSFMQKKDFPMRIFSVCIIISLFPILTPQSGGYINCYERGLNDIVFDRIYCQEFTRIFINYNELLNFEKYPDDLIHLKNISYSFDKLIESFSGPMDSAWPMKGHDVRHTGMSPYSTTDNVGKEIWRFDQCSIIEGGPVIDNDGVIYFGSKDLCLYAFYSNGTLKWKYKTGDFIWSTPAIADDGTIYIGSFDRYFYALYPDGAFKWKFDTKGSISSSPAIADDGTIYFGNLGFPDLGGCKIFAINPNGTEKWHYQTDYKIASSPAIGDDGTIYIGSGDTYLYAMNPDGTLKWRFKTGGWVKSHPSIADDGTIYFDSFDGYFYALYPNGTMKWRQKVGSTGCASASIDKDGVIYIGGRDIHAIYPNGTIKWTFDLGSNRNLIHASPAISSDGIIYLGICIGEQAINGGEIVAVNSDGSERWRSKISNYYVESSPCIGKDGTVYIGSAQRVPISNDPYGCLYAFGTPEQPNTPSISGPSTGKPGEICEYQIVTIDYQGDNVEYYMDWDDETNSGWIGPYPSGESITVNHTWNNIGTYDIRVKARDIYDHESGWSTLEVTMPKMHIPNPIIQLFMKLLERFPFFEKILNQL
jgi:outer membrane protein assembly factor BamB